MAAIGSRVSLFRRNRRESRGSKHCVNSPRHSRVAAEATAVAISTLGAYSKGFVLGVTMTED